MNCILKISLSLLIAITLFSFTTLDKGEIVGVYGVCESNPSAIQLTLNDDQTFTYRDHSNSNKPIDVHGNWELKNNHVILTNYTTDYSFHTKWKIDQNGTVAKSRKGMTWYTLGKI